MKWQDIYFAIIMILGVIAFGILMYLTPSETLLTALRQFGGI